MADRVIPSMRPSKIQDGHQWQTWKKIWILLGAGNESQDPSASAWPTIKGIINLKLKTNLRPPNKFLKWSIPPKRDTNCMISKLQFHCKIDLSSNWLKLRLYNLFCSQTPVPAQQLSPSQTRSWLCFPHVTTTTTTRTPTKIYQNEVYYRPGIWNIDWAHKIKTSPTIPGMVSNQPEVGHPPSRG